MRIKAMEETKMKNPWLGLESYKEGEVLYGRDEDIRNLSQRVLNDTDTLLYGKSGIGKSSILNAGIIPAARRYGYLPVMVRLSHKEKQSYLHQIKDTIGNEMVSTQEVVKCKDAEKESLYEYFHRQTFHNAEGERIKLLIIFDQFEEIFTLQEDESKKKRFFGELADFLNDVMPADLQHSSTATSEPQKKMTVIGAGNFGNLFNDLKLGADNDLPEYVTDNEIHMVFTIREDFLSEFEYYSASIPSLKQNRYGLRPINEEQAAQIILRPMSGLIDESVAKLIIEKVTGRKDFELDGVPEIEVDSAVLSLYLNRLYDAKTGDTITSELVEQKGGEIIADFYIDAISEISESTVEYLEDMLLNGNGRRDNITVYDAIHDGGATEQELDILCNKKKILRQFNYAGDLRIEYVHDILCPVVKAHKDERLLIKQQEEERQRQEAEKQRILLEEKAKREQIEREAEEKQRKLKEEAKRIQRKNRKRLYVIAGLLTIASVIGFGIYFAKFMPYNEYYGNYAIVNGWPEGLGVELNNSNDREKLIVHYRLIRKGWLPQKWGGRPFERVDVVDAKRKLCTNKFYETPIVGLLETELDDIKAKAFANLQRKTAYWVFSPGGSGFEEGAARCTAYSIDKEELYSIQYYRDKTYVSQDNTKYVQWAVFNDADGKQMMVTDNGVDRMRQTIKNGVVTGCLFFTELGTPQRNAYDTYGYQYEVYDTINLVKRKYCVDKFGTKIDSTVVDYIDYEYGRVKKSSHFEVQYSQKNEVVYKFETFNDSLFFNNNGTLGYGTFHTLGGKYSQVVFKYDNNGLPLLSKKYSAGNLVESKIYFYKADKISKISVFKNGMSYMEQYDYPDDSTIVLTFWKDNSRISLQRHNEFGDLLHYHKYKQTITTDSVYITETVEYRDSLDNPISNGDYAKYSISRDRKTNNNVILEYFYDVNGNICKSEWFEYDEYGNRIARAVAGLEGSPVRCPNWDWDGLSFYKMAVLYPFNNKDRSVFVSTKGLNEFGESSNISRVNANELRHLSIIDIPYHYIYVHDLGINETGVAFAATKDIETRFQHPALFVHVLSKKGSFYKVGLKDGDIIVKINNDVLFPYTSLNYKYSFLSDIEKYGGVIVVARTVPHDRKYNLLTFAIPKGDVSAETHPIELTEIEYNRLKNTIKNED